MAQKKKVSVRTLAAMSGVSTATVSRVLNNDKRVSEETRKLVLDAIEKAGYIPDLPAASADAKVDKIGVIIVSSKSDYYNSVLGSIGIYFRNMGVGTIAMNTESVEGYLPTVLGTLYDCNIQGLILVGCDYLSVQEHLHARIPHVWIDCNDAPADTDHICQVQSDHYVSGRMAAWELFKAGCRNPLVLTGSRITHRTSDRIRGFISIFEKEGIPVPADRIIRLPGIKEHVKESQEMIMYLVTKGESFDGIFADTDGRALGAYVALRAQGLRIPEDVRLIGFDGISEAVTEVLNISCVQQNVSLLSQYACEMLLRQIHRQDITEKRIVVPTALLPGQSI